MDLTSHRTAFRTLVALIAIWGARSTFGLAQATAPLAVIPLEPYLRAQSAMRVAVDGQPGIFQFDTGQGVTSISPAFVAKVGCRPWGRLTGFRMTGERLDHPHCDGVTFTVSCQHLLAPVVSTVDIMAFIGHGAPAVDGGIGLDLFAGRTMTIIPRQSIILESPGSLALRIRNAQEVPVRLVRDVEGIALTVNAAVRTADGLAWMELDNGNGGSMVIANHIAPLLGLKADLQTPELTRFSLANGIAVNGPARSRDLVMDGNIGAQVLNAWILTLDLLRGQIGRASCRERVYVLV